MVLKHTLHFTNNMEYTWTSKFIKELSKNLKLANKTQIWEHCMILKELTEVEKEMLVKELEQDVIEMQEVTKRWQSDMTSDSWLSKNIRPLSLAFLTLTLFIYIILDSSLESFKIDSEWVSLLGNLLMLVYGGYFGARTLEKIRKIK